jgi:uncharacterized protein (UPF0254 family)
MNGDEIDAEFSRIRDIIDGDPRRDYPGLRTRLTKAEDELATMQAEWRRIKLIALGVGIGVGIGQGSILIVLTRILGSLGAIP